MSNYTVEDITMISVQQDPLTNQQVTRAEFKDGRTAEVRTPGELQSQLTSDEFYAHVMAELMGQVNGQ